MSTAWFVALLIFSVAEATTVGLVSIWFALGALAALLVSGLGGQLWLQITVFLAVSAVSMLLIRPFAQRFLKPGYKPTNADRVIGQPAIVKETINNLTPSGLVTVFGQDWTARSEHNVIIPAGTQVKILRIEGVKVFVETE